MVRERIRMAIDASDFSQHQFSEKIGVATPNLNAFLKGARSLPYPKLVKALDELALTIGPRSAGASIMPPSEMPEIFRQNIDNAGMKIKDVAEQTGIDIACLSTFLNGSRTTPIRNIEKLMKHLDLDLVRLIRPQHAQTA
jgi:hypothetical protein